MERKTYKREIAGVMLIFLFGLVLGGVWYPSAAAAADSLKFEVFGFAAMAFGLDAWAKQISGKAGQ